MFFYFSFCLRKRESYTTSPVLPVPIVSGPPLLPAAGKLATGQRRPHQNLRLWLVEAGGRRRQRNDNLRLVGVPRPGNDTPHALRQGRGLVGPRHPRIRDARRAASFLQHRPETNVQVGLACCCLLASFAHPNTRHNLFVVVEGEIPHFFPFPLILPSPII